MRVASAMLLMLVVSTLPSNAPAQNQTQPPVVTMRDGGTSGRMESIFVPPLAGAPFSLMLDRKSVV